VSDLTVRQLQMLQLKARGLWDWEIAARLGITRSTVNSHMRYAARKLGVAGQGRGAVIRVAIQRGLIEPGCDGCRSRDQTIRAQQVEIRKLNGALEDVYCEAIGELRHDVKLRNAGALR
jgi:DNA-binding CsgD family transcriptional regulator